jgi:hypothetical protein
VIKFVSDLWQVGGFLWVSPVSSTNKTDRHDITAILLKVALNTIKPNQINGREKMTKQNKYHGKTIEIGSLTVI